VLVEQCAGGSEQRPATGGSVPDAPDAIVVSY
jgi:hypothetical protein